MKIKFFSRRALLVTVVAATAHCAVMAQTGRVLELWSFIDPVADNSRSKALKHVIDTFQVANPGTTVKTTVIQWQEISPQLLRATRAGKVPDVVMLYSPNVQTHIAAGTLRSLDPFLSNMTDKSDLLVLPEGRDDKNNIYALPWEVRVQGLMYRKDLLDKAGIPIPSTLPELAIAAGKLNKDGRLGFGLGFKPTNADAAMGWFLPTAIAMGARVLRVDGSPDFTSVPMVKLMSYIHDLAHTYKATSVDALLLSDAEVQQLAEGGRTGFLAKATHRVQFIKEKSGVTDGYQMMALPTFDPKVKAPAYVTGWTLGMPKASPNVDAAWKFMAHWTSGPMQLYQATTAGYLPVRKTVAASPELAKSSHVKWALDYAAQQPLKFNWPQNPDFLNATLAKAVEQVVSQKATPQEALAAAEKAYEAGIKR